MTQLLDISADAVNTMGDAHHKQAMVIQNTISINKEIADDISKENTQFQSINSMVESNVNDITQMSNQINTINGMVDEISNLLKREEWYISYRAWRSQHRWERGKDSRNG